MQGDIQGDIKGYKLGDMLGDTQGDIQIGYIGEIQGEIQINTKELSFSHKIKFSNPYIFATRWCKPLIFQTKTI